MMMMKLPALAALALAIQAAALQAIPQTFGFGGGGFFGMNERDAKWQPPGNIEDLDPVIIAAARWDQLPGEWITQAGLSTEPVKVLSTPASVFGQVPEIVAARYDGSKVSSIYMQFIDSGSYFGYTPRQELDSGKTNENLQSKQQRFKRQYREIASALAKQLPKQVGTRGKRNEVGRTEVLRSEYIDFDNGEVVVRLGANENEYIYIEVMRSSDAEHGYMDSEVASMRRNERVKAMRSKVERRANGDVVVGEIPIFTQGSRPYCAISTLGMVTHHFGLRIPVNGLAASAGIKKTGSAKGSKILETYYAAAQEADIKFMRASKFEFDRATMALDHGYPVLIWRRYDAARDKLHTKFAENFAKNPSSQLPAADDSEEMESWPDDSAPGHASIVTGYNAERGEVIFLESWGEHTRDRRMRKEELEATGYMVFYFKL
ncbi:MAG: hypothetical protein ACI8XO_001439 [Verrucomicrobiales bacterium]|jgi:hypothetical protein